MEALVRVTRGKPRLSTEYLAEDEKLVSFALWEIFKMFKLQPINAEPIEWSEKMVSIYEHELGKRGFEVTVRDPRRDKRKTS